LLAGGDGSAFSFASAHPLGATYIVNLCGTDAYYILKGTGSYASKSTVPYVRVLDGNGNAGSAGFTYMVL